jgi:hypothetical protein
MAFEPPRRPTFRQVEYVKGLREQNDEWIRLAEIDGIGVWTLITKAYEDRLDLDNDDRLWLVENWEVRPTSLSRFDLERLRRCCLRLGILGNDR